MPRPASARRIGFPMTTALVMGNMIGSGIFLLPSSLASFGGLSLFGWIVSAGGAVALALVFARLARIDPKAGGPYAFTRAAFGDLGAFLVAWGYWISIWSGLGALAVALVGYLTPFFPALAREPLMAAITAVVMVWVLIGVNLLGVRSAGWVQGVTTAIKILPLVIVGVAGATYFDPSHFAITQSGVRGIAGGVSATAALTLWAFLGLECATIPSSSINDPSRTIPRATVTGTILASAIYILGTVGVMSVLTPAGLAASTAPYADAARRMGGETAARLVAIGAAISCFGALNGWTLMLGQLPLAVARDGVFPTVFARTSRSGVPVIGTLIGGVLTTLLIGLNFTRNLVGLFTFIILLSTLSTLIPYVFAALAVFVLPERIDGRARPLTKGAAVTAGLAFVYSLWAIAGAGAETVYWGFILLIAGLPLYVRMMRRPPAPAAAPGVDDGVPSSVRASSTARAREASS